MKRSQLTVQWRDGLHIRPAARLVRLAQNFRSSIVLRANGRIADARSILSVMLLCAALGTVIDVEASGADEEQALRAVENAFVSADDPTDDDSGRDLEARGNRP
jgi:phosphocarrier protein